MFVCVCVCGAGTTGPPKAVMISHDNLTWTASVRHVINQFVFTMTVIFYSLFILYSILFILDTVSLLFVVHYCLFMFFHVTSLKVFIFLFFRSSLFFPLIYFIF